VTRLPGNAVIMPKTKVGASGRSAILH